jgi:uncharacterized protein (DUF1800 family)
VVAFCAHHESFRNLLGRDVFDSRVGSWNLRQQLNPSGWVHNQQGSSFSFGFIGVSMKPIHGKVAGFLLAVSLACAVPQLLAKKKDIPPSSSPAEHKRAVHALNRLTFGPRPGDVQRVTAMGVDAWIEQQLHPGKINDAVLDARLAPFHTLRMSPREVAEDFPDGGLVKQVMDGKKPMPSDAAKRAVFQVQIARQEEKQEEKQQEKQEEKRERKAEVAGKSGRSVPAQSAHAAAESAEPKTPSAANSSKSGSSMAATSMSDTTMESAANADGADGMMNSSGKADGNAISNDAVAGSAAVSDGENSMSPAASVSVETKKAPVDDPEARRREERLYADLEIQKLPNLPADQRYKKILTMPVDDQVAFADSLRGGKGQEFLAGMDAKQKETLLAMNNPQGVVTDELLQAKVLRAIYSERQLEEVMTDFWFNHFNVYVGKGPDRLMLANYEQEVIRPRAMGRFEDLLVATAKSPAMLFYLDNWLSVGPNSMKALGIPAGRPYGPYGYPRRLPKRNAKQSSGLNENYGRELLELHTLSVNGGYSQHDVTEAAKVFTGWTIDKPNEGGGFKYDPRMHEPGPKFILGHRFKPKGEGEGLELLHRLATSPQTAHFISLKLAQRFVSDDPPEDLVDRMAKTFLKKKGDIREVLSTLLHSPEFWAEGTYRAKVKTPLEFVASAVRVTGAEVEDALPLARQLGNMGMPLYGAQPPTGYSMKAETWVNSSALLNRMNFAMALSSGKIKGVKLDSAQLASKWALPVDSTLALPILENNLLAGDVSKQTHDSIAAQTVEAKTAAPEKKPANKPSPRKPADAQPANVSVMAGLLLGSPEFQKR